MPANRYPRVPGPDVGEFDITHGMRTQAWHLAFGWGAADRLQARVLLHELLP